MTIAFEVCPMVEDDAPALLSIAREWGEPGWTMMPGAAGIVCRDASGVAGFAIMRELKYGFVIDELWCTRSYRGREALVVLADWIERKVLEIAKERGFPISLGGIVRLDNHAHMGALKSRGYTEVAAVLSKEMVP